MRLFLSLCCLTAVFSTWAEEPFASEDEAKTMQESSIMDPAQEPEIPVKFCEHSDVTTEIMVVTENGPVKKRIYRCPSIPPLKPKPPDSE